MAALPDLLREPSDLARRRLLAESDELLGEVEELRLQDREAIPVGLEHAIKALQERLGRRQPPVAPRTVKAAHDLVLAVQQRLMAGNPRVSATRSHPGRGGGQAVTVDITEDASWKLLALPPLPPQGPDLGWLELVQATVERACDRWMYAHHQAVRAARFKQPASVPLARARAAWENYWELKEEAAELRRRGLHALTRPSALRR